MATLVSQIQALIAYANGVTSKSDTKLGDAVKSLADNYGNSGDSSLPDNYGELGTLSAQIQALITYANSVDGQSDTHIGDAMRHLAESTPQWMREAAETYGIPLANLRAAYAIDADIKKSFDGTGRWLVGNSTAYIDTDIKGTQNTTIHLCIKMPLANTDIKAVTYGVLGSRTSATSNAINISCYDLGLVADFQNYSNNRLLTTFAKDEILEIDMSKTKLSINSNSVDCKNVTSFITPSTITLFKQHDMAGWNNFTGEVSQLIIKDTDVSKAYFPFMSADGATLIDLMADNCTENLPTKVGTFTIE